jgi:diguanylate cyclase
MGKRSILSRKEFITVTEALPEDVPFTLASLDLDNFKSINDDFGHDAGDLVLETLTGVLLEQTRSDVIVARMGGDEFMLLFPKRSPEQALVEADSIHTAFGALGHTLPRPVTLSIGLAARPAHATEFDDLMRATDEALYRAKREGRGRSAIYVEDRMVLKSNYYSKATLDRLSKLSSAQHRTEASLLREGLEDLLTKYKDEL